MPGPGANYPRMLDPPRRTPQTSAVQTAGQPLFGASRAEESPGSTGIRCRLTAGGGNPRESATENKPPTSCEPNLGKTWAARVKRCGKSAPRPWQQGWQGKPHREQDRIGTAGRAVTRRVRGHSRPAVRVGRVRRAATRVPEEWLPLAARQGQNPAYRPSGRRAAGGLIAARHKKICGAERLRPRRLGVFLAPIRFDSRSRGDIIPTALSSDL